MATPASAIAEKLKLPEGAKADPAAIGEFASIFANEALTPEQKAQAVVDLDWKLQQAARGNLQKAVEQRRSADVDALKADKDFGGGKYDKTVADAQSALKQFGGEEASKILTAAGLDSHPAVVKLLARVRAALAEDTTSSRITQAPPEVKPLPAMSSTKKLAQRYLPQQRK